MIYNRLTEFLIGRIDFTVEEGFENLFFQECKARKLKLYSVKADNKTISGAVQYSDFHLLSDIAVKSGMKLYVKGRYGLPYIFYRYKKRIGVPIGLFLAVLVTALLSSVIWSVEVNGEAEIPEEKIYEILENCGASIGSFRATLQCKDIEFALYNEFEQLSWVSVYIAGSRMFIEIKERPETVGIDEREIYSDIIASKDGEIIRADIYKGEGKIYPGTAVLKGDVLVKGETISEDETVKYVRSEADIYARTYTNINSSAAKTITASKILDMKNTYSLYFFGLNIIAPKIPDCDKVYTDMYLFDSLDIVFPVGIIRYFSCSMTPTQIELNDRQALLMAFCDFSKASMVLYKNSEVIERTVNLYVDSQITIESKYLCVENISEEKIIAATKNSKK